jgi:transaldolase
MLFLDSTDLGEIESIFRWGVVKGLTTNPLLLAKAGISDVRGFVDRALSVSSGPISLEVTAETEDAMFDEAEALHGIRPDRIAVKVPFSEAGLAVTHRLESRGIRVNVTCCMSHPQAYLAASAGATYVSILAGRVRDMGYRAEPVFADLRAQIDRDGLSTKIIAGSLRQTVPALLLRKMLHNPKTDETIREFNDAWHGVLSTTRLSTTSASSRETKDKSEPR